MRTKKPKKFLEPALKKLKAEMAAKPIFDATSISSLDGGTTYPVMSGKEWTLTLKPTSPTTWKAFTGGTVTSTSTTLTGTTVGSGWSSGLTGISGTWKSTGAWHLYDKEFLTDEQTAIVIDVICEEIIGR